MGIQDRYIYRELAVGITSLDPRAFFQSELDRIQQIADIQHVDCFVMSICWEYEFSEAWFAELDVFFSEIRRNYPNARILLLLNSWYEFVLPGRDFDVDDVCYVDHFLFRVYVELVVRQKSPVLQHWDPTSKRILFLTGKSHRINRARLLYKLMTSAVGTNLDWSLRIDIENQRVRDACRNYLDDISDQEFSWFLSQQRSCDQYFAPTGIPYDPEIYRGALFQIVSETNFDRPLHYPSVTEKIWLAIFNCRPFVLAGELGALDYLESKGFWVFRELLPVPNYDNPDRDDFLCYAPISGKNGSVVTKNQERQWHEFYQIFRDPSWPDSISWHEISSLPLAVQTEIRNNYNAGMESLGEMRLDAIVENAVFWQARLPDFAHEVQLMVQLNQSRALELGRKFYDDFLGFMTKHGVDFNIDYLVTLYDLPAQQRDVYNVDTEERVAQ